MPCVSLRHVHIDGRFQVSIQGSRLSSNCSTSQFPFADTASSRRIEAYLVTAANVSPRYRFLKSLWIIFFVCTQHSFLQKAIKVFRNVCFIPISRLFNCSPNSSGPPHPLNTLIAFFRNSFELCAIVFSTSLCFDPRYSPASKGNSFLIM